tara:strand:- start:620 stop:892 length:273 start_codon:yes stop_codon:yes gene_type:complete
VRHRLCEVGSVEPTALHWPGETQGARAACPAGFDDRDQGEFAKKPKMALPKKKFHLFEVDREFRNFTRSVGDIDRVTCLLTAPLLSTIPL